MEGLYESWDEGGRLICRLKANDGKLELPTAETVGNLNSQAGDEVKKKITILPKKKGAIKI